MTIDTLRADHVGAYGSKRAHTPTLDGLAAAGARFDAAVSPVPLTLPSHTTLLTGLDPMEHGVRHNGLFRLDESIPTLAESLQQQGFATAAFVGAFVLDEGFGLARGFDHYDDEVFAPSSSSGVRRGFSERKANQVVDAALGWLESAPPRFFLWVHVYDPHADYAPPPGFAAAAPGDPYSGEIAFADAQIGRLLRAIDERFADGRTLVAVTSDHGEGLGQHGESSHSNFVYQTTQHVPLLLAGPGIAPQTIPDVVGLRDVAPTLIDLLDGKPLAGASGRSLRPLLEGGSLEPRPAWVETLAPQFDWGMSPLIGLRMGRHKFIDAPRPELYDLVLDPAEETNLVETEPEAARRLAASVAAHVADARPVEPNVALDPDHRARLEALGYVVPARSHASKDLGVVGGIDPKDGLQTLHAVEAAERLLGEGRPAEALSRLEQAEFGSGRILQSLRATMALAAGDAARAEAAARAALESAPDDPTARHLLALALVAESRPDEARTIWLELVKEEPRNAPARLALGDLAQQSGDSDAALEHFLAARTGEPSARVEAAWAAAALLIGRGDLEQADALIAAHEPSPERLVQTVGRVALAEAQAGLAERARRRLTERIDADPRYPALRLQLADLLVAAGETTQAAEQFAAALAGVDRTLAEAEPTAMLYVQRAKALRGLGREHEAREAARMALAHPGLSDGARRAIGASMGATFEAATPQNEAPQGDPSDEK